MNRSPFKLSGPERRYAQALNGLANHIEALLAGGDPVTSIIQLDQYASAIDQWAVVTAQMMIDDVNARNRQFWRQQSEQIGRGLAIELANTDIAQAVQDELRLQVELIKSLPRIGDHSAREGISGRPPSLLDPPPGCPFAPRCPHAMDICTQARPPLVQIEDDHLSACFLHEEAMAAAHAQKVGAQS